jgi:hypothetical protein
LRRSTVSISLYEIGRRLFGTWQAAVEEAGLTYEEVSGVRRWSRRRVIERIRKLAADGVCLHATYIKRHYHFLYRAAIKLFPSSWSRALRAAGLSPADHRMPRGDWNRSKAEDWVRKQAARKRSLFAKDAPRGLSMFVHRHIGMSWGDYLESLGIRYPGIKRCRDWTKRKLVEHKLVEQIRRRHAEGHRLSYRENKALVHQARKFFGSWDKALAAAGIE